MLKTFPLFLTANFFRTVLVLAAAMLLLALPARPANIVPQWVRLGPRSEDSAPTANPAPPAGLAVDGNGTITVAGAVFNSVNSNHDFYTARYAGSDGAVLWERGYNGPAAGEDRCVAMALDANGNVLVTGSSIGSRGYADFYTAKYAAADGLLLWEKRDSGPSNGDSFPKALAVDFVGNVIVTGSVKGPGSYNGFYTTKYAAADGSLLWQRTYTGLGNGNDDPVAVVVDALGNVVVTGRSADATPIGPFGGAIFDFYTAKYAGANGALIWERRYSSTFFGRSSDDDPTALALAPNGDVVVTGITASPVGDGPDIYTAKYAAANGALLWEKYFNGPQDPNFLISNDYPYAVAVDSTGNVVVTGSTFPGSTVGNIVTHKYAASDGALMWQRLVAAPVAFGENGGGSKFRSLLFDSSNNVILAGSFFKSELGDSDFFIAKYAAANGAVLLGKKGYSAAASVSEEGSKIAFTPDGGLTVLGTSFDSNTYFKSITTVKYLPTATTEPPGITSPTTGSAFINTIPITYYLPDPGINGSVKLTFANATTTVLTLANTDSTYGIHSFTLSSANLNALGHVTALSGPAALADGIYTVTLSYQDAQGDAVAATSISNVRIDHVAPALAAVTIASNGGNPVYARSGNFITVIFAANEVIQPPTATILGSIPTITNIGGNTWQATRLVPGGASQETAFFSISVKDLAGNVLAPVTATTDGSSVTIDRAGPTLTLLGANPQTVEGGTIYVDPGATASDAVAGNLDGAIQVTGVLNMNVVGTYLRAYTVTDFAGNTTTRNRTVRVVDTTPAVITILGDNPATVGVGGGYLDAGATATDTLAGNLTAAIRTTSSVNANAIGEYAVTYTVSDGFNTTRATRTVRVIATPIAGPDTLGTVENIPVVAAAAKLLANDTDPNGHPLGVTGVSPTSGQGGAVGLAGGLVTYSPPSGFTGADSFTYTIANGFGVTANGVVSVTVGRADGTSLNLVSMARTSDGFQMVFAGIPGDTYLVQFTDSLSSPVTWQTLTPPGPIQAGPNGLFQFEDKPNPIPPQRYYRAAVPQ